MLLDIPNETCAGLKKLSTWFGMRSLQKIANILCEWVTKKKHLAHQISSQYKVWMETAIRNTSNSFLQPPPFITGIPIGQSVWMFHFLLEITYKCLLDGAHIRKNTCLQNYHSIILGSLSGVLCLWCISVCSNQYTNLRWASLHYGHTHWIIRLNVPSLAWDHV